MGFVGVLIAMNPGGESFTWIAILPLLCAACYAATQILARQIGETESSLTVGLWTLSLAGPVVLVMGFTLNQVIAFGPEYSHLRWTIPNAIQGDLPTLLLLGLIGMAGYTLLSRAYQVAEASIIAPFDYSYLPIAAVMGWWLWGEVPPVTTVVGMALIAVSGLYIAYRELRPERSVDDQALVAETVTVPGTYHAAQSSDDGDTLT